MYIVWIRFVAKIASSAKINSQINCTKEILQEKEGINDLKER